jgi:hypothetical protein
VIRAAGADIVGIQETRQEAPACSEESCPPASESVAAKLAAALGFHYYDQAKTNDALWANAILSRYPIGAATPNDLGVAIDVEGRRVFASTSTSRLSYQPYQASASRMAMRHSSTGQARRRAPRPGRRRAAGRGSQGGRGADADSFGTSTSRRTATDRAHGRCRTASFAVEFLTRAPWRRDSSTRTAPAPDEVAKPALKRSRAR